MGEVKERWSVTYTKHVKQKRKVYQDGCLHLLSNNKIMLYDESEQLLDSRFLTKDEIVKSEESLPFNSFLVDIGDPESNNNTIPCTNLKSEYEDRTKETSTIRSKGKLNIARRTLANSISPSQKIIRDFRKNELIKHEVQQARSPPSATSSSFTEWEALYTTQITQKAKKYHDGFIRVIACGSQGRQIMLYDSSKTQLDKRFLKKDEIVSSGESLTFDAYLVDIGDCMSVKEDDANVALHGSKLTEKADTITGQHSHKLSAGNRVSNARRKSFTTQQGQFKAGKPPATTEKPESSGNSNVCSMGAEKVTLDKAPQTHLRDAHQILSILRNPTATDRTSVEQSPAKQYLLQQPPAIHSNSKSQDFHSSIPNDQHESRTVVEKCLDEDTKNEAHPTTSSDANDTQSETCRDDLPTGTGSHRNDKARAVCTQGTQVGSALIDKLRAGIHHGTAVIMDSGEDADLSPAKSEGGSGTHNHQPQTKLPATFDAPSFDLGI